MCARLEIRTGRFAHTHVAFHRARAVRAKCSLAGLTDINFFLAANGLSFKNHHASSCFLLSHVETKIYSILGPSGAFCLRQNAQRAALRAAGQATSGKFSLCGLIIKHRLIFPINFQYQ